MAQILMNKPEEADDVVRLLSLNPRVAVVVTKEVADYLAERLSDTTTRVMLEESRLGYILIEAFEANGEKIYEIPNHYVDILFFNFF